MKSRHGRRMGKWEDREDGDRGNMGAWKDGGMGSWDMQMVSGWVGWWGDRGSENVRKER